MRELDEATLLKAYGLETLEPTSWHDTRQDANEEEDASVAQFDGEPDPLNLRPRMPASKDFDPAVRAHLSLGSKVFDPKLFLSQVHPDATFADLSKGVVFLKESIDQRSEALKVLVQENFDRFVAVKATNDGVFREMREPAAGPLREGSEYGTQAIRAILAQASAKADQAFMPVLENNLKAGKLRSSLGVFERSKFFFNLPAALGESIDRGRYDIALRDYRKGMYLMQSRPGQLLAMPSTADTLGLSGDANADAALAAGNNTIDAEGNVHNSKLQAQQKRVFDKVWSAVTKVMDEMEARLFAQLKAPGRSVEEHIRTMEILLELKPAQDPVSICLEAQRSHARNLVTRTYDSCAAQIDGESVSL